MRQRVEPLNEQDAANLEAKREWVRGHYAPEARHSYASVEGKLEVVATILERGWVAADETLKLQCLGVAFGDALGQRLGLAWVAVEDAYGRDPALCAPGSSMLTFPMTSIAKRIERGEAVDVERLFTQACAAIREHAGHLEGDLG